MKNKKSHFKKKNINILFSHFHDQMPLYITQICNIMSIQCPTSSMRSILTLVTKSIKINGKILFLYVHHFRCLCSVTGPALPLINTFWVKLAQNENKKIPHHPHIFCLFSLPSHVFKNQTV